MRVYDNGVYRDATPEEIAAWEQAAQNMPAPEPTPEERIEALETEKADRKEIAEVYEKIDAAYTEGVNAAYDSI